jgi:hypothetical protein
MKDPDLGDDVVRLWVPDWSSTLCGLGIFVYQSAESIATSEARLGWRRRWWEWPEWCCVPQGAVAMVVEVRHVLGQHCGEMAAVND